MKVPFSWIKEFVDIDVSAQELGDKLVSAGFEIEEYINLRDSIQNVVVGQVESIEKHKDSDHLNICLVNVGKEVLQIVTGAQNVRKGDKVPVALDGAVLPDGKRIKSGELRGVASNGMLCSGGELGLAEEDYPGAGVNGILILKEEERVGEDINDVIGNDEIVLDVAVTANRPDCNSILGIAREVAAVMNKPLRMPDLSYNETEGSVYDYIDVENRNYTLCPRYMAKAVVDVVETQSPKIIRDRLKAVGIRPINNLVDVTNYVLTEIGQPMHAFDLNNLSGKKIIVRNANDGEKIVALDGKEYALKKEQLAICDAEKPVAIAGVMGGEYSSICATTNTVILESARFARDSIRHTARELGLHSDSSARYEKGVDFYSQELGLKRALSLFDKYKWGKIVGGVIDLCEAKPEQTVLKYDYNEINAIIGVKLEKTAIIDILNRLDIATTAEGDTLTSVIPPYREDIYGVNDLTEEVIRIYGYDVVEPRLVSVCRGGMSDKQLRTEKIREILVGKGAFETVSYAFVSPKSLNALNLPDNSALRNTIEIRNPIGADMSVMRTNLVYSMLKTIEYNYKRGNKAARFFEIGNTYLPKQIPLTELPEEKAKLSVGFYGANENYYTLKGVIDDIFDIFGIEIEYRRADEAFLHPGRSAYIYAGDRKVGFLGEVHPDVNDNFDYDGRVYVAELDEEFISAEGIDVKPFKPFSRYQGMQRDIALLAPESVPAAEILSVIRKSCSDILEDAEVFDVYSGGQTPAG
ncbi:MAG: phenylalanine--tRNA ligase subunit beta, partial [Christensenellales bacterium]